MHIYLQTNAVEVLAECEDYPLIQLLSDLGGVIGLYLGMTVVALIELGEMLLLLLYIVARRTFNFVTHEEIVRLVCYFCSSPTIQIRRRSINSGALAGVRRQLRQLQVDQGELRAHVRHLLDEHGGR